MDKRLVRFLSCLLIVLIAGLVFQASIETAKGVGVVTVTASVATSVTCTSNIASTAFGALTTGAVTIAASHASTSLSCNTGLGCTLTVADAGNGSNPGLSTSSPAYLIPSSNATLVAGTEGYGIQATTTAEGSGGTVTVRTTYNVSSTNVGGLTLAGLTLASSTAQIGNRSIFVRHLAAISPTTQAAQYVDTITYSCTGN